MVDDRSAKKKAKSKKGGKMTNVSPYTLLEEIDNVPACPFCKMVAWEQVYKDGDPWVQCKDCCYRISSNLLFKLEGTTLKEAK